ncbi:MAG: FAD/NAD(P)-binding protein [Humidesulfovibrio sp.]|uniref:FAD/NAD(P)-binding protein n=1 Tax=Humidesulfovibrio sp. TaxID=2910988 RepID=UPI002733B954|nr:FAD/NAD(P)-binding protein [Humidesulfovibrio sp.]MDP2847113.1 FAD/NAD(P)-binding protein [Humidesulfovibrio sp.]
MPMLGTIIETYDETPDVKTFRVVLKDEAAMAAFRFQPGQVAQLSVFGTGESTFVICSPPTRMDYLQFSVMRVGELTHRLHTLREGDPIGIRGPLGNHFPHADMKGKDIVFIGGGLGLAPLRTLLLFMLDNRQDYGNITLVYGGRTPEHLCFKDELKEWAERGDMRVELTVDTPDKGWTQRTGVVPAVLTDLAVSPKNAVAVTCGPPIMIRFTIQALEKLGFTDEQIVTTLERRMKCGIGLCGRCNIGEKFVCVDGPVFTQAQLKKLPQEF